MSFFIVFISISLVFDRSNAQFCQVHRWPSSPPGRELRLRLHNALRRLRVFQVLRQAHHSAEEQKRVHRTAQRFQPDRREKNQQTLPV